MAVAKDGWMEGVFPPTLDMDVDVVLFPDDERVPRCERCGCGLKCVKTGKKGERFFRVHKQKPNTCPE